MKRAEFAFSIGYSGKNAVVDKKALTENGKLGAAELSAKGLYRAAFASALYGGDEAEMKAFMADYNAKAGKSYSTAEELSRVFGVYPPTDVKVVLL